MIITLHRDDDPLEAYNLIDDYIEGDKQLQERCRYLNTNWFIERPLLTAPVAQWLEQSAHNRLVGGSNPSGSTFFCNNF